MNVEHFSVEILTDLNQAFSRAHWTGKGEIDYDARMLCALNQLREGEHILIIRESSISGKLFTDVVSYE